MVRTTLLPRQQPDPIRIAAISASISVNVILFMFLMQPPAFTPAPEKIEKPSLQMIDPPPRVEVVPVTPQPPTPPVNKQPLPPHPLTHNPTPPPPLPIPDKAGPIDPSMPPPQPPYAGSPSNDNPAPPKTIQTSLRPTASPAPSYPLEAAREAITGTVQLEILVGVDGSVLKVTIVHSSGDKHLDDAARDEVMRSWHFQPAVENGVPVQALGRVPIVFKLDQQ